MQIFLSILISYVLITLFGHVAHWALHQPWMGRFYKSHLIHHSLYPASDFESQVYRDAGKNSSAFIFFLLGLPLLLIPVMLCILGFVTWVSCAASIFVILLFGFLNDFVHDSFHIKDHHAAKWWPRYTEIKKLHLVHHINVQKNFGIYTFFWDFLFKTLKLPPVNYSR